MIGLILLLAALAPAGEMEWEFKPVDGVRAIINMPADLDPAKPTLLIIYACPNGNSAEQTLGAKLEPGMDWHFDIQHVAAQVRKLRQLDRDENIAVAVLEADKKSWPGWRAARPENGKIIRGIVDQVSLCIPAPGPGPLRIALTGHSGGGSFIFGYINGADPIADDVRRIVWLDANYAYKDEEHHGEKLLAWLKGDPKRQLVIFAYDDSKITLNGKPVLKSPMGGTFGSSHRMIDRLSKDVKLTETKNDPFDLFDGMNGQIHFRIHTNPENKILHTVLVERNGFIEAMTLGTQWEHKWGGEFWGDRAYADLIAPNSRSTTRSASSSTLPATTQATSIPPRPAKALGGKAFAETIADLPPKAREAAIVDEITRGNIPDFLRKFHTIHLRADGHECTCEATSDYLAIGSDDDFVRMPMTPASAQRIADAFGCSLPTRKMVNDIYAQADVKLEPKPLTEQRETVRTFVQHNAIIEEQRAGKTLGLLVAGDKKDIVITNKLKEKPNKVAIYGWHKLDGKPIQPLYTGHADYYADYSHGVRLIKRQVIVDGKPGDIGDVLKDPALCNLLSDEGPIDVKY
jgi:hypothetical protein